MGTDAGQIQSCVTAAGTAVSGEESSSEVARAAGLNQGHYSRIENGLLPEGPSEDSVARIAKTLSFPTAFFYQNEQAVGMPLSVHPFTRKKQSVADRDLKRIYAELNFRLIHLRKFLTAIDTKQVLPLPLIDVDEGGGPRKIARTIRIAWRIPSGAYCKFDRTRRARWHHRGVVRLRRGHRWRDHDGRSHAALRLPE